MIRYFSTVKHQYPIQDYLTDWGTNLRSVLHPAVYEKLRPGMVMPKATYIFSDLDRLAPDQLRLVTELAKQAEAHGLKVLNHPGKAIVRRYPFLKMLWDNKLNDFNVYGITEEPHRFPVFARVSNSHWGKISELINSQEELNATVAGFTTEDDKSNLIIEEFLNTSDSNGIYRKYSFAKIGDKLIPRHLLISKRWITKEPDIVDDESVAEELRFLEQSPHPHEPYIRRIFALANIDYGRIDYGVVNGKIQIWEINTNPIVIAPVQKLSPLRMEGQTRSAKEIEKAFLSIDHTAKPDLRYQSVSNPSLSKIY